MIVECDKCSTRFRIADERVTDRGVKVRCGRCSHVFVVRRDAAGPAQPEPKSQADAAETLGFSSSSRAVDAASVPPSAVSEAPPTPPPRSLSAAPDPFSTAVEGLSEDVDPFADIDLDAPSGSVTAPSGSASLPSGLVSVPPPSASSPAPSAAGSERFPPTLPSIPAADLPIPPPGPPAGMSADIPGLLDSSDPFSELELSGSIPSAAGYADTQASGGPALSITDSGSLTGPGAFDSSDGLSDPGIGGGGSVPPTLAPEASAPYSLHGEGGGLDLAPAKPERASAPVLGRIALKARTTTSSMRPDTIERQRLALLVTRGGEAWPTRVGMLAGLLLALLLLTPWVPGTEGLRQLLGLGPAPALPVSASGVEVVVYPRGKSDPVPVVVGALENRGAQPLTQLELVVRSEGGDALHFPLGRTLSLAGLYRGDTAQALRAQALADPLVLGPGERRDFSIAMPQLPVTALGAPLKVEVRRRGDLEAAD